MSRWMLLATLVLWGCSNSVAPIVIEENVAENKVVPVKRGVTYWVPVIVTSYVRDPKQEIDLSADVTLYTPDGAAAMVQKALGRANSQDPRTPGLLVLSPVFKIAFDPGDKPGRYRIEYVVRERDKSAKASVTVDLK